VAPRAPAGAAPGLAPADGACSRSTAVSKCRWSRALTRPAGAVWPGRSLSALNDSKQHSAQAREELYPLVLRCAARVAVVSRSVSGIDERGLHVTNLAALRDALRNVTAGIPGEVMCLVDGFSVPEFERPQRAIVDGDATSAAIAAASIIAKVTRDRYMQHADTEHPGWGFAEHVGYSTPVHREAIARQGVSPLHRMSFQSLAYQQLAL
jgi:ribonuclease HII